MFYLPVYTLQ
nr:unnamed protein product [Callosobruchus analis]